MLIITTMQFTLRKVNINASFSENVTEVVIALDS